MSVNSNKKPVAVVTGASSGIGLGVTRALIEHGYSVVANSRSISKSKDLIASTDLVLVDGDIGKRETAIKVVDAAVKQFERIDWSTECKACLGAPVIVDVVFEIEPLPHSDF